MQDPAETPKKKSTNFFLAGLMVLYMIGNCLVLALFVGGTYWVFDALSGIEKTYYEECQYIEENRECKQCCEEHGHNEIATGDFFTDGDRSCACID